jgi:putative tributyrin esterase
MAIAEFHFTANNSLHRMTSAMVLMPEKMAGPYPVLYLLHGRSDDHTTWTRRSNIDRYVEGLPLIVVMPNGERGWYADALLDPSKQFESLIIRDLIPFIDATFRTVPTRKGRAIAGLSMGGYGAMRLGLKHADLFGAIHCFSAAFGVVNGDRFQDEENRLTFGDEPIGSEFDLYALAHTVDKNAVPQIRFDCGRDDFLIDDNRDFAQHLTSLDIPHVFTEYSGAHSWPYWNEHILDALPPLLKALGISSSIDRAAHLKG